MIEIIKIVEIVEIIATIEVTEIIEKMKRKVLVVIIVMKKTGSIIHAMKCEELIQQHEKTKQTLIIMKHAQNSSYPYLTGS